MRIQRVTRPLFHSVLPPLPSPARHSPSGPQSPTAACLPARACWTLLGFVICTGTVAGMLPGLLTGPLGKEALGEKTEQSSVCGDNGAEMKA